MIIELIILFEIVAFLFLALGLFPHQKSFNEEGDETSTPFLNKAVYIGVAAVVFFIMSAATVSYDYTHCFVNQTMADYNLNTSTSTATCQDYIIESTDLSYFNLFMGMLCLVLGVIISLFAALNKKIVGSY